MSEPTDNDVLTWTLIALVLLHVTDGWVSGVWFVAVTGGLVTLFVADRRRKRAQRRPLTEPR